MKPNCTNSLHFVRFVAALLVIVSGLSAQTTTNPPTAPAASAAGAATPPAPAPTPTPAPTAEDEEKSVVVLSVFEVASNRDNSYGALDSNSLAAFRMDLAKSPVTAEVFTQAFMNDIAASSIEEMLTGYSGTVTASSNNPGAGLDAPGDRDGAQGISIRGVSAGEIKRDGFIGPPNNSRTATGSTEVFSIDRVDVISGPQSILYGSVGGGGVVNSVTKRAQFNQRKGSLRYTLDNYGSKRALFDYNYGREKIAARVALIGGEYNTNRYRLGVDYYGIYAQLAFRPFRDTTIRFSTEKTDYDATVGFKPGNLNNFLSATDPRRNKDTRYLVLTGQVGDLRVFGDQPITYGNMESTASWWSSERIATHWNQMIVETKLPFGFSAQLVGIYTETLDNRVTDGRTLLPGRGSLLPDGTVNPAGNTNPFDVTAVAIGAPVQVNEQRDRNKGVRLSFVHETDFKFWGMKGKSQTAFGGQAFHRGPTFGSSGTAKVYYQADTNWNILYTHANGTRDNTPDYSRTDYGRTPLANIYFPVQNGIPSKPFFRPGTDQVTVNGQNYVLAPRIYADPTFVSPGNPFGLRPNNNPAAGTYTGNWNRGGETHSGNVYAANFTDWFDGRLTTLVGYSITRFETYNVGAGSISPTPKASHPGYQFGLNYRVLTFAHPGDELRAYAIAGTAEQAESSTSDILGVPLKNPKAQNFAPEFGLKATMLKGRFTAQLSYNPSTKTLNENKDAGTDFRDAINPNGINGRVGGANANQRVNIDRTLSSQELILSANPTQNWTVRLKATHLDGEISNDVIYRQNYNDQFFLNGTGVVTYSNGTPLLVNGAGILTGPRDTPLTLTMINTVGNPYYANPNPTSGIIQNATLRTVLTTADPVLGMAATGVTGLPISAVQYNFTSPYSDGNVPIFKAGEKNVGFNEYTFNFQNKYEFKSGFVKGLSVFGDLQTYAKNRAYYTNYPDTSGSTAATRVTRVLYRYPSVTVFNFGIGYRHKGLPWIGDKITWSTQLNIRNAFNHYKVWVVPTSNLGTTLNARLSALPRTFVWSNTIEF